MVSLTRVGLSSSTSVFTVALTPWSPGFCPPRSRRRGTCAGAASGGYGGQVYGSPSPRPVTIGRGAPARALAAPAGLPATGPGEHSADVAGPVVELVVEVDRGVDQGKVAERLGEVAELFPGQADLLREQAQVVGVGAHLLEH